MPSRSFETLVYQHSRGYLYASGVFLKNLKKHSNQQQEYTYTLNIVAAVVDISIAFIMVTLLLMGRAGRYKRYFLSTLDIKVAADGSLQH